MSRIVVGLSGGVDSSVAALLLKAQGHEVIGVFMNNWEEQDETGACTAQQDFADVRHVCDVIDIPYYAVNFAKDYKERVFSYFLSEYQKGRTPNPDVLCNREIKFKSFLNFARTLGADKIATGHFADVDFKDGRYRLLRSGDENKDQTYFLYMLDQLQLSYATFPINRLTKAEVREIARKNHLPVSEKKDSTGVCFIGERNFKRFLQEYLPAKPGDMVTTDGKIVGRHDGLMYYTLGQRRGLGLGGIGGDANGGRWFVLSKDLPGNRLIVGQGAQEALLYSDQAVCENATWIAGEAPAKPGEPFRCMARLRHRQPLQAATATVVGAVITLRFDAPQRAITPGQSTVLYKDRVCLGGGTVS